MAEGTEHHLEHAEHVQHAAHDPFDRRVAMTMAIVAAVLACVTMLSHRSHNETLRLQSDSLGIKNEAIRFQSQANIFHTRASDQWSYFQAKKNREYLYDALAAAVDVTAKESSKSGAAQKVTTGWKAKAKRYESEAKQIEADARALDEEGKKAQKAADEKLEEGAERLEDSHRAHHSASWFDYGELGIEMSLVLCSIALLTKRRSFWHSGMVIGAVGSLVASFGLFPH